MQSKHRAVLFKCSLYTMTAIGSLTVPSIVLAQAQPPAAASEATFNIYIPAQPLARAVSALAEQTGLQVLYPDDEPLSIAAPAVRGRMTTRQALTALLAGSGYSFRYIRDGVVTLEKPGAADGARLLGAVRVEGAVGSAGTAAYYADDWGGAKRSDQEAEANGYRPYVATVGTSSPRAIEDVPRSVSVITQKQFEDQAIDQLDEALRQLPGLTLLEGAGASLSGSDTSVYARGLPITKAQVDGGAALPLVLFEAGLSDLAAYERVELLRGPNGGQIGNDSFGGTINFVRKKPLADETFTISAATGTWNQLRLKTDYSVPTIFGLDAGFRIAASAEDREYFYDKASSRSLNIYAVTEIKPSDDTKVEFGGQYLSAKTRAPYSGLERYAEGPILDLPYTFNVSPDWSTRNSSGFELFSRGYWDIGGSWKMQIGAVYRENRQNGILSQTLFPTPISQLLGRTPPGFFSNSFDAAIARNRSDDVGLDGNVNGSFDMFGLKHDFQFRADWTRSNGFFGSRTALDPSTGLTARPEAFTIEELIALSERPKPTLFRDRESKSSTRTTSYGFAASDTVSLKDLLFATLTLRYSDAKSVTTLVRSSGSTEPVIETTNNKAYVQPLYTIAIKPSKNWSAFLTIASGTQDQSYAYDTDGTPLDPSRWKSTEVGVRYSTDAVLFSLTGYWMDQVGVGVILPNQFTCLPDGLSPCYSPSSTAVSHSNGIDVEVTGRILPELSIIASLNYNETKAEELGGGSFRTEAPTWLGKAFFDYTPMAHPELAVQAGIRFSGKYYTSGVQDFFDADGNYITSIPFEISQKAYAAFDLGFRYKFTDMIEASVFLENVSDKRYLSNVIKPYYGNPRNITATVRLRF